MSSRTELQASNLVQTAASVEQLSFVLQTNADTVSHANLQAGEVRNLANGGAGAIAAVEAVQDSAKRMGEIVELIDSMAFQTNILALNAAVEAAPRRRVRKGFCGGGQRNSLAFTALCRVSQGNQAADQQIVKPCRGQRTKNSRSRNQH